MAPGTLEALAQALRESGGREVTARGADQIEGRLDAAQIPALAERLADLGAQCQLLAAADTRERSGDFTLVYAFAPASLRPRACVLVSIASTESCQLLYA